MNNPIFPAEIVAFYAAVFFRSSGYVVDVAVGGEHGTADVTVYHESHGTEYTFRDFHADPPGKRDDGDFAVTIHARDIFHGIEHGDEYVGDVKPTPGNVRDFRYADVADVFAPYV